MIEAILALALQLNLAADPQWLNLVHYRPTLFSRAVSDVDSENFFLSPDGKKNPQSELDATLRAFALPLTPGESSAKHAQCVFPARLLWLKKKLGKEFEAKLPRISCLRADGFLSRIPRQSVHLVFSSYYVNNPSSSFGHTLLRFSSAKPGEENAPELLDVGVNYAANATTSNALFYAISGISGLFKGTFSIVRYFEKVREYNDAEARDLWSYELALTPEEIDLLAAHVYEMSQTHLDYFYLTENCAFHMLSLLDAAAPRFNLLPRLRYWVIPSDTVKAVVNTPDLVRGVRYRPAARSRFLAQFNQLSAQSKSEVKSLWRAMESSTEPTYNDTLPPGLLAPDTLDTALDFIDYRYAGQIVKPGSKALKWRALLLRARAESSAPSKMKVIPPPTHQSPEFGHGSARVRMGYGVESNSAGRFAELGIRFALHDLLDRTDGYPQDAWIEFLNLRARLNMDQFSRTTALSRQVELEEFTLFRVTSLNPIRFHNLAPSWRIQLGLTGTPDRNCDRCVAWRSEFGAGYTLGDASGRVRFYLLNDFELSVSHAYIGSTFRLGIGPRAGLLVRPVKSVSVSADGGYRHLIFAKHRAAPRISIEAQWSVAKNFSLRAIGTREARTSELMTAAQFYF